MFDKYQSRKVLWVLVWQTVEKRIGMGQKDGDLIFGKLRNEEIYDSWVRNGYHVRFWGNCFFRRIKKDKSVANFGYCQRKWNVRWVQLWHQGHWMILWFWVSLIQMRYDRTGSRAEWQSTNRTFLFLVFECQIEQRFFFGFWHHPSISDDTQRDLTTPFYFHNKWVALLHVLVTTHELNARIGSKVSVTNGW